MFTKIALVALIALVPALSGATDAPIHAPVISIQPGSAATGGTI